MDAMETETETYDTIMKKCLATMLDKLTTVMPTAGDTERDMLAALWENQVHEDEALDADQAKQIDSQLQRPFKQLLKHLDGKIPKPPPGRQPLATAALGAMLAQLDGPDTGARVSDTLTLAPSAEQRDGLREGGRMAVAALQEEARRMQMDLEAEVLRLRAETAAQKRSIDALTEASKKSTAAQRASNATLALAEMSAAAYEQVKHSRDSRDRALSTAWLDG